MELDFFKIGWRDLNESRKTLSFQYVGRKENAFAFFNDFESSTGAYFYMILELIFILVSVAHFIIEEDPSYLSLLTRNSALRWLENANILSYAGLAFFSFDFVARIWVSLDRIQFFKELTTWFDIIALLPYFLDVYIQVHFGCNEDCTGSQEDHHGLEIIMILKIFRIARCFKIIRRSERLRIIVKILGDCAHELGMMLVVWIIGILLAGSLGYISENSLSDLLLNKTNPEFSSILESTWWAQITMSSIGYGDITPVYPPGQVAATLIILGSTVLTAIPMTFIIRRFSQEYDKVAQRDMPLKVMGSESVAASRITQSPTAQSSELEDQEGLADKMERLLIENATYAAVLEYRKRQAAKKNTGQGTLFGEDVSINSSDVAGHTSITEQIMLNPEISRLSV